MIPVEEALARILEAAPRTGREWVPLASALGRVLAGDLRALRRQPPVAVSAMDGFAVRASDARAGALLRLVGESRAGAGYPGGIGPGETVRIFTGAPLPAGADAVLIQEHARMRAQAVEVCAEVEAGRYIRPAGLDFEEGWLGLAAGTVLDARAVGLAAAMGHGWVPVRRRPRVALLATGDELVWPGSTPGPAQIVSSNSLALAAMVRGWGGEAWDLGIAPDRPEALADALREARGADVVVTTGGASVGSYDFVREAAGGLGLALDFWKIAMRPGKPLIFGRLGGMLFLGLPGNPVSAAVCALVFLRAVLRRSLGLDPALATERARVAAPLPANDERRDYLRAFWRETDTGREVVPADRQDSSMFALFARADALIVRPPHDPPRQPGERVEVVDLRRALAP